MTTNIVSKPRVVMFKIPIQQFSKLSKTLSRKQKPRLVKP